MNHGFLMLSSRFSDHCGTGFAAFYSQFLGVSSMPIRCSRSPYHPFYGRSVGGVAVLHCMLASQAADI
jgi:hypothetical protein